MNSVDLVPNITTDRVQRMLRRLPPRERAALVLRYAQNLSEHEVATVLGCRPVAVRALVRRGVRRLRHEVARDAHAVSHAAVNG
jgi:RNA polymerase sigma factor (sigma-70 family)